MSSKTLAMVERQLKLVTVLDSIRDRINDGDDPKTMFQSIASALKNHFGADACAILLVNETTQQPEMVTGASIPPDMAIALCQQAIQYAEPTPLASAIWTHTLGFRIILEEHASPLGSLFIGRKSTAFNAEEIALLKVAEGQIDSAVLQARLIWKLAQRNRELEAIFQIDRLRDDARDELDLINGFTNLVLANFQAELCMVILSTMDSGEFIVRGMVDKSALAPSILEDIRAITKDIQTPQIIPTPKGMDGFSLIAAPFYVGGEKFGAMVVGRKSVFNLDDNRLAYAMMSQMDTAIVHNRTQQQLAQRKKELEVIYGIDHIRDQVNDFDAMLLNVLTELCRAISSEMGYLMLYNAEQEDALELKATTRASLLTSVEYIDVIKKVSREALDAAQLIYNNEPQGPIRSIAAIPLILNDRIIGVFGALNSANPAGFDAEDRRMLTAITSQVDTAVFERLERRRMRDVLGRSVDPKVLEALLQSANDHILVGERVILSVLFADLRGSTEWAERTEPEEFVSILNSFLGKMTEIIFKNGGTLDKFVGDEVIALFGTPISMEDHAYFTSLTAIEMQKAHKSLQAEFAAQGKELPPLGIGVSTGEVIAGEFGPPVRTDFTAMGRVMNLGARLCGVAGADQIVISHNTRESLGHRATVNTLEPIKLKGISNPTQVYELLDIKRQ